MSFTPAIPSLSAPMGASPKPTLVLDLEGVGGQDVKLCEWLYASKDGSDYDFIVDWGDGLSDRVDASNYETISHNYTDDVGNIVKARIVGKCNFLDKAGSKLEGDYATYNWVPGMWVAAVDVENTSPLKGCISFRSNRKLKFLSYRVLENYDYNHSRRQLGANFEKSDILEYIDSRTMDNTSTNPGVFVLYQDCPMLREAPINLASNPRLVWGVDGAFNFDTNLEIVYIKNAVSSEHLEKFIVKNHARLPNRTGKDPGKLYLMSTPGYEDKSILMPTQEHIDAAAAMNWVFADPAELSQE